MFRAAGCYIMIYFFIQEEVDLLLRRSREMHPIQAIQCCQSAIQICRRHGLLRKQACIHCQMFQLLVRHDTHTALKEAENAIRADPNYELVSTL